MTWVAWRQQRPATLAALALLAVAGPILLVSGWRVTSFARDSGLAACVAAGGDCRVLAEAFANRYGSILEPVSALGALLRWLLACCSAGRCWPVSSSRAPTGWPGRRASPAAAGSPPRLAMATAVLVVVAAVAAGLLTWWWGRFDQLGISSRAALERGSLVPVAAAVLAFSIATAAGARTRRVVPALAVGLVAVLVVAAALNLAAQRWLPPRPLTVTYPAGQPSARAGLDDQVVGSGYRDRAGRDLSARAVARLCPGTAGQAVDRCLAASGIQRVDRYQPAGRAWQLALAQSALYLVVAALFLVLAWWRTLRPD